MINPHLLRAVHVRLKTKSGAKFYVAAFETTKGERFHRRQPRIFRQAVEARRHAEVVLERWVKEFDAHVSWLVVQKPPKRAAYMHVLWIKYRSWRMRRAARLLAESVRKLDGIPAADKFLAGFEEMLRKYHRLAGAIK